MTTLFISDIHLEPARADITQSFIDLLRQEGPQADAVYLLGDLFEFWLGDDDKSAFSTTIKNALKTLSNTTPTYIMSGNRDFLLGKRFMKETGCQHIPDPTCIDLYGQPTLLMHGDLLCTLDHKYQSYRKKVRRPFTQKCFLMLPLFIREKLANKIRKKSHAHTQQIENKVMDACQSTIEAYMKKFNVDALIHGHTHKPAIHYFQSPDQSTLSRRIVLSDWHQQANLLKVYPDGTYTLRNQSFSGVPL